MRDSEHIIVVDIDGVALNWDAGIHQYLREIHNVVIAEDQLAERAAAYEMSDRYDLDPTHADLLTQSFNHSLYIANLAPIPGAVASMKMLYEEYGFQFHAVTAIGAHPLIREARLNNLYNLFGRGMWKAIDFVRADESKKGYLEQYRDSKCLFIEDHVKNAILGQKMGLEPVIFSRSHNKWALNHHTEYGDWHHHDERTGMTDIPIAHNWSDVVDIALAFQPVAT